jgi:hypothetical protein
MYDYPVLKFKAFDRRIIEHFANKLLVIFFRSMYMPGTEKLIAIPAKQAIAGL